MLSTLQRSFQHPIFNTFPRLTSPTRATHVYAEPSVPESRPDLKLRTTGTLSWDTVSNRLGLKWQARQLRRAKRGMVSRSVGTRASARHSDSEKFSASEDCWCVGVSGYIVQSTAPCEGRFEAFKAASNSDGFTSRYLLDSKSLGLGSTGSMEKSTATVASRSRRSSNRQPNQNGNQGRSPEQYLAAKKQEAIDNFMARFKNWLDKRLATAAYAFEASSNAGYSCNGADEGSGDNSQSGGRSGNGKRHFDDNDQNRSPPGNHGNGGNRAGSKRVKQEEERKLKLACPFFKHDPSKHGEKRSCVGPGWKDIHRVKEHLYRNHLLPKHSCARCTEAFDDGKILAHHLRSDPPCKLRKQAPLEGIDEHQEKKLKERKKVGTDVTLEQRWNEIYLILFPNADPDALPSPYYEPIGTMPLPNPSVAQFKEVQSRIQEKLPKMVRKEIEGRFQKVEVDMLDGLNDIIRNSLHVLFNGTTHTPSTESSSSTPRSVASPAPAATSMPSDDIVRHDLDPDLNEWFDTPFYMACLGYGDLRNDFSSQLNAADSSEALFLKGSDSGYVSNSTVREPCLEGIIE